MPEAKALYVASLKSILSTDKKHETKTTKVDNLAHNLLHLKNMAK